MSTISPTTNQPTDKQAGVSLLLSILILAAITAIAFSLSTIISIEINASGDILRTEPIVYAVQGVAEEGMFQYKRQIPPSSPANLNDYNVLNCTPSSLNVCAINNVTLGQPTLTPSNCTTSFLAGQCNPITRNFDTGPRIDTFTPGQTRDYLMIDPRDPYNTGQAYTSFKVTLLNNGTSSSVSLNLYDCGCDSSGNKTTVLSNQALTIGTPYSYNITTNGQYDLSLSDTSLPGSGDALVQVEMTKAVAVNGQTNLIPLIGGQTIDITAVYLGLTRKYTVQVPIP